MEFGLMRSAAAKADKPVVNRIRKREEGNFLEKSNMHDSVERLATIER